MGNTPSSQESLQELQNVNEIFKEIPFLGNAFKVSDAGGDAASDVLKSLGKTLGNPNILIIGGVVVAIILLK